MQDQGDTPVFKHLSRYAAGTLKANQRSEIEYRLKVEPRFAEYLNNLTALNHLERLRTQLIRRKPVRDKWGRLAPRVVRKTGLPPRSQSLWILDEEENAYLKAAVVVGNTSEVLRTLQEPHQPGQKPFAVTSADTNKRTLYLPDWRPNFRTFEISVVHSGVLPQGTLLNIIDKSGLAAEHNVIENEHVQVVLQEGRTVLRTRGSAIPDIILLLT